MLKIKHAFKKKRKEEVPAVSGPVRGVDGGRSGVGIGRDICIHLVSCQKLSPKTLIAVSAFDKGYKRRGSRQLPARPELPLRNRGREPEATEGGNQRAESEKPPGSREPLFLLYFLPLSISGW